MISRALTRYLKGMSSGLDGNSFLMQPGDKHQAAHAFASPTEKT